MTLTITMCQMLLNVLNFKQFIFHFNKDIIQTLQLCSSQVLASRVSLYSYLKISNQKQNVKTSPGHEKSVHMPFWSNYRQVYFSRITYIFPFIWYPRFKKEIYYFTAISFRNKCIRYRGQYARKTLNNFSFNKQGPLNFLPYLKPSCFLCYVNKWPKSCKILHSRHLLPESTLHFGPPWIQVLFQILPWNSRI